MKDNDYSLPVLQEVPQSSPQANNSTTVPNEALAPINPESGGSKVKAALDRLKDSKKDDDESKSMPSDGEAREEPMQRPKSDHRTEASGEKSKDRDRERERERDRDRERERRKSRDRDRGRDSDRERDRDEMDRERDKVKDRGYRSKDRMKDSGEFIKFVIVTHAQIILLP